MLINILLFLYGEVSDVDEKLLIKKIKSGDMEAFSQLVSAYEKKAVAFARRMLGTQEEAEDATQEAFLKVFDKIHTFRQDSSFSTWFYTVLNNICLDALRKRSRRASTISINQTDETGEEYELDIKDTSDGPYEAMKKNEAKRLLEIALTQLSDEHRTVIILRDINGFEYEEIAQILKISTGTVKSRISRARLALRKILEEHRELFL